MACQPFEEILMIGKLGMEFGVRPNFWNFLRLVAAILSRAEADIQQLLFAAITPNSSPL